MPVKKPVKKVVTKKTVAAKTTVKKAVVKKVVSKELPKETSLKQSVFDIKGKSVESITLPKEIFGVEINKTLISQAVRVYLANQRRGTVKTKSRGEVNISTRKIYKQKGTGRARHGAASAPIFVGGGVAFGPRQRDYSMKLNQKAKKAALFSSLSAKLKQGEIKIVTGLEKLEPKTKNMADVIAKLQLNGKNKSLLLITPTLVTDFDKDSKAKKTLKLNPNVGFGNVVKSARNMEGISIVSANLLNTYEVLKSRNILFMKDAIKSLEENFLRKN